MFCLKNPFPLINPYYIRTNLIFHKATYKKDKKGSQVRISKKYSNSMRIDFVLANSADAPLCSISSGSALFAIVPARNTPLRVYAV